MRKWIIKQMEKFGLDSSNLKTQTAVQGHYLQPGEMERIVFPNGLENTSVWRVKEWFFKDGQLIQPGNIVGVVENARQILEFETYVGGKFYAVKKEGQKVEVGSILFEVRG
ncbi:biotin/lipoyl-containing protein [Flagellimonas myxillae]|uniref:biotin/lipoyl-containing protein n=1 Tax=Flagellimonas myxillae TaxID=2942214 RepID=UPI00201F0270|nr:biotin/lipoyl-containing protein [Muricauda myxillae]MCL6267186.1 hypothetical protein [Muricauda myxillae]